jgi:hypothetical protein
VDVLQQHTLAPLPDISATSGTKTAGAIAGNAGAVGNISYVSAPGVLAVSADAFASVGGRTVPPSIKDDVAAAQATVLAEIIDQWIFKSDTPVKRVHVNASFRLAGDLTTTAEGVNATPAKFNQVESTRAAQRSYVFPGPAYKLLPVAAQVTYAGFP